MWRLRVSCKPCFCEKWLESGITGFWGRHGFRRRCRSPRAVWLKTFSELADYNSRSFEDIHLMCCSIVSGVQFVKEDDMFFVVSQWSSEISRKTSRREVRIAGCARRSWLQINNNSIRCTVKVQRTSFACRSSTILRSTPFDRRCVAFTILEKRSLLLPALWSRMIFFLSKKMLEDIPYHSSNLRSSTYL